MKFAATAPEVASMRNNPYSFAVGRSSALSLAILLLAATALARGGTEIILHEFAGRSGGLNPNSSLIMDTAGNLYGTTWAGGWGPCSEGCGKAFKLTPNGSGYAESVVYAFQGSATGDGQNPWGALTADAAGNLYGVTQKGGMASSSCGPYGCGTVFELTPGASGKWTETVLYRFAYSDGVNPTGKLIFDSAGNLYGVTLKGGLNLGGVLFELSPSAGTWTQKILYSFVGPYGMKGSQPVGIIFDGAGILYGVTALGGVGGAGVVFQFAGGLTVIHTFSDTKGTNLQTPTGGLIFDAAGNLYMTMSRGDHGGAGVVELSPSNGTFTTHNLYSFAGPQVQQPYEGLVFDPAGNLYSASSVGGNSACSEGCGFVYKLTPGSPHWTATKLASMNFADGAEPVGGVILDSKGNVYGVTFQGGGAKSAGLVFEVTP